MAEEPVVLTEEHYADGGANLLEMEMPTSALRLGPAETLDYEVIIHIDRVIDYSPLPDSPSHKSMTSDTCGIPDDELEEEWPVKHRFTWRLGEPDRRPAPARRRVPVHERLGACLIRRLWFQSRRTRLWPDRARSGTAKGLVCVFAPTKPG
jgi:hypothetical protein